MKGKILTDETTGRQYREIPVRSAYPYWTAALVWAAAAFFVPMTGIFPILGTAAVSLCAGLLVKKCGKKETRRVDMPFVSGNAETDTLVRELDASLDRIHTAGEAIAGKRPETASRIQSIEKTVTGIRDCIIRDPEDAKAVRRFLNYYLPTTVKLTEKYAETVFQRAESENAAQTAAAIDTVLVQVDEAFKRQYDALFANDRLDITSDITVLETMLKRDNLA